MTVTIKDIAKRAGVSVNTVSRALNNKPDVSKGTRHRVLKIAKELNYAPHSLAKSLVTKKTNTIGIIIPNMDQFYAEVVDGITNEFRERGYSAILCNSHDNADKELELVRVLREKRVDGLLICPIQADNRYIKELENFPIPFVFLNRHTDAFMCDYVINDNVHGAYLAVDHLIQKGYRNIIYICAKPTASSGKEKIAGCKKAIHENRLSTNSLKIISCKETIDSCYETVKELLVQNEKMDAIFVWDDRLAIGAKKAIFDANLRIPQDIAIIGYDDLEISKYVYPSLTTIRQPTYEIGQTAACILFDKIKSKKKTKTKHVVLKPELIVRKTT